MSTTLSVSVVDDVGDDVTLVGDDRCPSVGNTSSSSRNLTNDCDSRSSATHDSTSRRPADSLLKVT